MEIKAVQKYVRMTPRKLRAVVELIREMSPHKALETLPFVKKRAALPLSKVIKTALANAKDKGVSGELVFKEIQINEGPTLKRGRAVSRGRWHAIQKKSSHIRVILETTKDQPGKILKDKKKVVKK